jgi:hypothetical protein
MAERPTVPMARPLPQRCAGSECDFARDYEIGQSPLMLQIEQRVRGSAYGATSWTTRAQSEGTAHRLGLGTGQCLLEIGGGAGWPALFLAALSGCEIVVTDIRLAPTPEQPRPVRATTRQQVADLQRSKHGKVPSPAPRVKHRTESILQTRARESYP